MADNLTEVLTIRIDSNAAKTAKEDAAELENLRKRFDDTSSSLKSHEAALRRLQQGGVVNIATARELKTKIQEEKNALAAMTEKVTAAGKSFESLSAESKKSDEKLKEATKSAGELADAFGGGLVAALLAVEGAALLASGAFAKFVLESANLARSQQLARQAVTGSEEDAKRLGSQVDALALRVPLAKAAINDMAVDMRKAGITGQTLVDTLNATAQAASAVGDESAKKLRELVDRGRLTQRFSLGAFELQGTGLQFNDVAEALAKNMKTSLADAQTALLQGRVTLGEGAAALRSAVEKKFGGINLAKMLDFGVMKQKFGELLQSLTSGVNLEPLVDALKDFFSLFDQSTEAGAALKKLTTVFGQGLVDTAAKGVPVVKGFFEELIFEALQLYIAVLKLELRFKKTFGDVDLLKNIDLVETGITAAKVAVVALTVAFVVLGTTSLLALGPLLILVGAVAAIGFALYKIETFAFAASDAVTDFAKKLGHAIGNKDHWRDLGAELVAGLLEPISKLAIVGENIGNKFKAGFKKALGINSPSKVFAEYGENTAEGFGQGVERRRSVVADKLGGMAAPPASSSGAGGGVTIRIENITIQVSGAEHHDVNALAAAIRRELQNELTRIIERDATSVGQPVAA